MNKILSNAVIPSNEHKNVVHEIVGRIHSFETFGTLDGPGIRFIVFFQGCMMRCLYCHNRDTWDLKAGRLISVDELMTEIITYKHFIMPNGGGVTASGGEAILQAPFVTNWFRACHAEKIHTCLDTNGYHNIDHQIKQLLEQSDLVMLDLKHLDYQIHKKLVGVSNKKVLQFAKYLQTINKRTWIRYVVVPGFTADENSAHKLGEFIYGMDNIEKVELLPYHQLGVYKWADFGDTYQLAGVEPPSKTTLERLANIVQGYGHKTSFNQ